MATTNTLLGVRAAVAGAAYFVRVEGGFVRAVTAADGYLLRLADCPAR